MDNVRRVYGGITDAELTQFGMNQAKALSKSLSVFPVHHLFCSPLKRAQRTALEILKYHDIALETCELLKEQDLGSFEGLSFGQVAGSFRVGGESKNALYERSSLFYTRFLMPLIKAFQECDQVKDTCFVIVSHGLFLGALLATLCGFSSVSYTRSMLDNTGYHELHIDLLTDTICARKLNETFHLKGLQRQKHVGSERYDDKQAKLDRFLTKR